MSLINLLSIGPGTSVYHFLVLLALGAMGGIALIEWRHTGNPDHRRVLWAFGGLAALRLPLLLVEPRLAGTDAPAIVAPLLGGIEIASLTLLGWAFLSPSLSRRNGRLYLFGGLGAATLCAITFLPGWYKALARYPNLFYVAFWQQTLWYAVDMLATALPALILLRRSEEEKQWQLVIGFAILSLGFVFLGAGSLTLTVGEWGVDAYTLIGLGRFIHLLGYPLFAIAVYRAALQDMWAYRHELQAMSEEALRQTKELHFLVEISQTLGDSLNLDTILHHVVESVTMVLNADRCAIFLVNPDESETTRLAAQYTPLQRKEQPPKQPSQPLNEQPTLDYVLQRRKPLLLNVEADNVRLQALYKLLGSQKAGPTIVQPLLRQRRALGVLVVGNDHSQRPFGANEGRLCQSIATQVAATLENVRLYRDLKAQARQLAELLQSREEDVRRRTAILESIAEGVIVSDREGRVVNVNAAAERIMGASRQRIMGRSLEHLVGNITFSSNADWKLIAQSDTPLQTMFELEGKIVHISAAPVLTPAGDQLGIVAVLRDVTKETEAEQTKSEFITAISHELRTPLTAIRGYAEALTGGMAGDVDEAQSHFINIIRDNALRMVNLSDNLIAIAQLEKGFIQLEYGDTDLNLIVGNVLRSFQSQFESRQLEVSLELADDLLPIEADPALVRQVLDNLVDNAVKFTHSGGRITIGTYLLHDVPDDSEREIPRHQNGRSKKTEMEHHQNGRSKEIEMERHQNGRSKEIEMERHQNGRSKKIEMEHHQNGRSKEI
ncbi:MAG: histidine kinase dimerization/phospho-acceptor domain-containing protein, partial [Chloroflexota bacterium]|nr:histidine kinase dimerization/phospho-acceptor domain-containing protein [Chloroflexota bacterium]